MTSLLLEFQVRSDLCPLVNLTETFRDNEVEYLEMARVASQEFLEVFEVRGPNLEGFREAAQETPGMARFEVVEEGADRLVCQAVVGSRCIRTLLASHGWIPLRVRASEGHESVAVAVKDLDEARQVVDLVRETYHDFELSRIVPGGRQGFGPPRMLDGFGLTRRQKQVLMRALTAGYFDARRGKTATEIASNMEIDRSTFSRHLRLGLRKILAELLQ